MSELRESLNELYRLGVEEGRAGSQAGRVECRKDRDKLIAEIEERLTQESLSRDREERRAWKNYLDRAAFETGEDP